MNESSYYRNLIGKIISNSSATTWEDAVQEWEIVDWDEDVNMQAACICGKENIRYLFTIENKTNKNTLDPIGSQCIKKFDRKELDEMSATYEKLFKLKNALSNNKFIGLSSEYFSRKLLLFLYQEKVFDSSYNNFDGKKDYDFMLKMFNKREKSSITKLQQKKINAIIINNIIPFLEVQLDKKK